MSIKKTKILTNSNNNDDTHMLLNYSDDIWEQSSFDIINTIKNLLTTNKIPNDDCRQALQFSPLMGTSKPITLDN